MPEPRKLTAKINGYTVFNLHSPHPFTFVNSDGSLVPNGTVEGCAMSRVRDLSLVPVYLDVSPWDTANSGRTPLEGIKYQTLIEKLSVHLQNAILKAQANSSIDLVLVDRRVITASIHSDVPLAKLVLPKPYDCRRRLFFADQFLLASDLSVQHIVEHDSVYKVRKGIISAWTVVIAGGVKSPTGDDFF